MSRACGYCPSGGGTRATMSIEPTIRRATSRGSGGLPRDPVGVRHRLRRAARNAARRDGRRLVGVRRAGPSLPRCSRGRMVGSRGAGRWKAGWLRALDRTRRPLRADRVLRRADGPSRGVGRALIERAFPVGRGDVRSIIATTDVRALTRYYGADTAVRFPILTLVGAPETAGIAGPSDVRSYRRRIGGGPARASRDRPVGPRVPARGR